jgi:hypothetical protein
MAQKKQLNPSFFKKNGLTIVFAILFLISLVGQFYSGYCEHNNELRDNNQPAIGLSEYIYSGHFLQATFENWESEFLQMALFVVLTTFLYQKGSSESKSIEEPEEVDKEPSARKRNVPWPVKTGGWVLGIYKHSLSLVLFLLFALSFVAHFYGSLKDFNEEQLTHGHAMLSAASYISNSKFWFESFQNWQSEFLSVIAIVTLSIFLRQKGSPQSKPVDAPDDETGE